MHHELSRAAVVMMECLVCLCVCLHKSTMTCWLSVISVDIAWWEEVNEAWRMYVTLYRPLINACIGFLLTALFCGGVVQQAGHLFLVSSVIVSPVIVSYVIVSYQSFCVCCAVIHSICFHCERFSARLLYIHVWLTLQDIRRDHRFSHMISSPFMTIYLFLFLFILLQFTNHLV